MVTFPDQLDRVVPLVDVRWSSDTAVVRLSDGVYIEPPSRRRAWVGLIVSDGMALVLPYPVPHDHLRSLLWAHGELSVEGSTEQPDYGVFLQGGSGPVWAIPEGRRILYQAVLLHYDGNVQDVYLQRLPAAPLLPPLGLWEVPHADWARIAATANQ